MYHGALLGWLSTLTIMSIVVLSSISHSGGGRHIQETGDNFRTVAYLSPPISMFHESDAVLLHLFVAEETL
jgi:hypothetical protein